MDCTTYIEKYLSAHVDGELSAAELREVEEHREWSPADRGSHKTLVWRRDARVLYRELDQAEADALAAVSRGATFAEICEVVAADGGKQDPVAAMNRMLARWLSDGLLVRG